MFSRHKWPVVFAWPQGTCLVYLMVNPALSKSIGKHAFYLE